jgi:2-amino-4-hydroxy-6-hydroxymethyldihydropteridine diphosphokinase
MAVVYLSLGSNLGDRVANLRRALHLLAGDVEIDGVSSVWETEPWGLKDQPWFLNIVCRGDTNLSPHQLLTLIKEIERQLGRQPTIRYGPRTIDIDILLYDRRVIRDPELQIPHPRLAARAFVLYPLREIAPAVIHPVTGKSATDMVAELENMEEVRKVPNVLLCT